MYTVFIYLNKAVAMNYNKFKTGEFKRQNWIPLQGDPFLDLINDRFPDSLEKIGKEDYKTNPVDPDQVKHCRTVYAN